MATYEEIQNYVKEKYGYVPETCWIADVKGQCGIPMKEAPNRISSEEQQKPCPPEKIEEIRDAIQHCSAEETPINSLSTETSQGKVSTGTASMVWGIISLAGGLVAIGNTIASASFDKSAIACLVFGIIAVTRRRSATTKGKVGMITGTLGIIFSALSVIIAIVIFTQYL